MGFNNGSERKKFEAQWSRLRVEYAACGMDESMMITMYEFDWQTFNSDRRYAEHTQTFSRQEFSDDGDGTSEDRSPLLMKFLDPLSAEAGDTYQPKGINWVEEIESENLWEGVSKLSDSDRKLLTLYVFYGYSITEIARMQGVTRPAVSKRLIRVKRFLKKFFSRVTN